MNNITKIKLYKLLEEMLNVSFLEKNSLTLLVEDLYDLKKNIVIPLDELETKVIRKKYGIYDGGMPQSKETICNEYDISDKRYSHFFKKIIVKLIYRIKKIDNYIKVEKVNSLDTNDENILNKSISSFPINTTAKNKLMKEIIITFQDLMEHGINELSVLLGPKELENLIEYVHSLNYKFINELTDEEIIKIINNNSIEIIGNSSPYLIHCLNNYPYLFLKRNKMIDIKSLVNNANILPKETRLNVIKFLNDNNLSDLLKKSQNNLKSK